MLKEFEMTLIERLLPKYKNSSKSTKSKILDEYISLCNVSRNTAIKRFERFRKGSKGSSGYSKAGRPKKYGSLEIELIRSIYLLSNQICAERLHPMIGVYIEQIRKNNPNFNYPPDTINKVLNISLGSLKRIIRRFEKPKKKRYFKSKLPIYKEIPVVVDSYNKNKDDIGAYGLDFVEHKGNSSNGYYAITMTFVNYFSQWISRVSALGKDSHAINSIFERFNTINPLFKHNILSKLHQDNDKTLLSYLYKRYSNSSNILLSRTRAYHSNDNCIVEQKNGDKVRNLVGYWRYDTDYEVGLLNEIWEMADLIDNSFIPSYKIKAKLRDETGRLVKKIYDPPKTPYQRLMECKDIPDSLKEELTKTYNSLNLIQLQKRLIELLSELFELKEGRRNKSKTKKTINYEELVC